MYVLSTSISQRGASSQPDEMRRLESWVPESDLRKALNSSLVSPKRVVGCRGGSRHVEGVLGFLVSWCLVSWFQSFSVSKF